jgi:hypothetical protein
LRPALSLRIALLLPVLATGLAHGGCALSQSAPDVLTISISGAGSCDGATLRASLRSAIARHDAGASHGGGGRPGAFSHLARTTNSNLFKLGMAPSAAPPPTLLVMPGSGAK